MQKLKCFLHFKLSVATNKQMPLPARSKSRNLSEYKQSYNDFAILMNNAEKQVTSQQRIYRLNQLMSFILSNRHMNEMLQTDNSFRLLTIEKCKQYSEYNRCTPKLAEICFKLQVYVNSIIEKLKDSK